METTPIFEQIKTMVGPTAWKTFEIFLLNICNIPHKSNETDAMQAFIIDYLKEDAESVVVDEAGNILASIPYKGERFKDATPLLFQAHYDMVCTAKDPTFDFSVNPITPIIQNGWLKADNTTLGADNGIGFALMLALTSTVEEHPPFEYLFTNNEEVGLKGALALDPEVIKPKSKCYINLDSEEITDICLGCAGGKRIYFTFNQETVHSAIEDGRFIAVKLSDLYGGHSGCNIHQNRANAIKILGEMLSQIDAEIIDFKSGNATNAIPREGVLELVVPPTCEDEHIKLLIEKALEKFPEEKTYNIKIEEAEECSVLKLPKQQLTEFISRAHSNPIEMLETFPELPLSSACFTIIDLRQPNKSCVSCRSSGFRQMTELIEYYNKLATELNVEIDDSQPAYRGCMPSFDNPLVNLFTESYEHILNKKPHLGVVHAGLELFLKEVLMGEDADCLSFGPTIEDPHSIDERLHIESTDEFIRVVLHFIDNWQ
ncbi:hypothetical protein PCE1_004132 [Barthelona sp. PCE]